MGKVVKAPLRWAGRSWRRGRWTGAKWRRTTRARLAVVGRALRAVDAEDVLVFGGLALVAVGVTLLYSLGLASIIAGSVLAYLGAFHGPLMRLLGRDREV